MINSRRIVKNSLWLYLRMLVVTIAALYTSRIVLKGLGVEDFGIYNAVGSIVAFLSVLTSSMSNATQRFLNVRKGEGDVAGMGRILGISNNLYIYVSLGILLLAETLGMYFVMHIMVYPEGKLFDAVWCYQSSIIALVFTVLKITYQAVAVTYEKFGFIAWTSFIDVFIKLGMAFCLVYLGPHRLIYYGLSFSLIAIIQFLIFKWYCDNLCKATPIALNKTLSTEESKALLSFSGWNLFGNFSSVMANQGICIILNVFYSVAVNAAMGLTNQVTNTVSGFVNNVQAAFRPQLLQSYTDKDKSSFLTLLYASSKWSFFLLMLIAVPLITNIRYVLSLWLGDVPEYTDSFVIILVGFLVLDSFSTPFLFGIEANGHIKKFQIVLSFLYLLNVVAAWLVCRFGCSPNIAILSKLCTNIFVCGLKIMTLRRLESSFSLSDFAKQVLSRVLSVFLLCGAFIVFSTSVPDTFLKLVISCICFFLLYPMLLYAIGLSGSERALCHRKIKALL